MNDNVKLNKDDCATVLVVDDDTSSVHVLRESLAPEGYQIKVASDGQSALKLIERHIPDIILLDIRLPDIDGYKLCEIIQENPLMSKVPIIFVTLLMGNKNEQQGLNLGAVDYISKPFNPEVLRLRVRNHLSIKKYHDGLANMAMYDALTNIANRRHFDDIFVRELRRSRRSKAPISLIMIDIDYFKLFNDNYGHQKGDECLIKVAESLKNALTRGSDLVARYGGEEFICLLPDTGYKGAQKVSLQLLEAVREQKITHEFSLVSPNISISLGLVTSLGKNSLTPKDIIEQADQLLYKAKEQGRNIMVSKEIE